MNLQPGAYRCPARPSAFAREATPASSAAARRRAAAALPAAPAAPALLTLIAAAALLAVGCGSEAPPGGGGFVFNDTAGLPTDTATGGDTGGGGGDATGGDDTSAGGDVDAGGADTGGADTGAVDASGEDTGKDVGDCKPTEPPTEVCDNIDNDCNGATDDGACDDGNPCTDQTCDGKRFADGLDGCTYALPSGTPCDDGSACTEGDSCAGGQCQSGTAKSCDDNNSCTIDKCKVATGQCDNQYIGDGKFCNDGLGCTNNDTCKAGTCAGTVTSNCDDGVPCTKDGCDAAGACTHTPMLEGPCDDGNPCTSNDTCSQGFCFPGDLTVCDDGKLCTEDFCDPSVGGCVFKPKLAGTACAEGLCAVGGSCDPLGNCVGLKQVCDDGKKCTVDSCDKVSGACTNTPLAAGTPCDDGEQCTTGETCDASGACNPPAGQKGCDDGDSCTKDICNPITLKCSYEALTGACDDGDGCTEGESCATGTCKPGPSPQVSTLAGDGTAQWKDGKGAGASFFDPRGVTISATGILFVADTGNHRIRRVKTDGNADTFSGAGVSGFINGPASVARFNIPAGIVIGADSTIYVADKGNHRVRLLAGDGSASTFSGNGSAGYVDGAASTARFNSPEDVAVDGQGNVVVADTGNNRIRRIDKNGNTTTLAGDGKAAFADGNVAAAQFFAPTGLCFTGAGALLVADSGNHRVRRIVGDKVDTFAGTGAGSYADGAPDKAAFKAPWKLAVDGAGRVIVADAGNHLLRAIEAGGVTTIAGSAQAGMKDDSGLLAQLNKPSAVVTDKLGNVYFGDAGNNRIRLAKAAEKICNDGNPCTKDACDKQTGACTFDTLKLGDACDDGSACSVNDVCDLAGQCKGQTKSCDDNSPCTDDGCNALTGECEHKSLNKVCDDGDACTTSDICVGGVCSAGAGAVATFAGSGSATYGDGQGNKAHFSSPEDVVIDAAGTAYVADTYNHRIRKITASGQVTTLAGSGSASFLDGPGNTARFYYPAGITVDGKGNLYVADRSNHRVRHVAADGTTSTLAGNASAGYQDGKGSTARFNSPQGVDYGSDTYVYVADAGNHRIRRVDGQGVVTTVAGSSAGFVDGAPDAARFNTPYDVLFGPKGDLFVADYGNHRVRRVDPNGSVNSLAGSTAGTGDGVGDKAQFSSPSGLALDPYGHILVVTRSGHRLRRVTQAGEVSTLIGAAGNGYADGAPGSAKLSVPSGVALAPDGSVLIADRGNHRIRQMASTKTICADNLPCTLDACDKQSGKCSFVTIAAGGQCEDGNGCTVGETCDGKGGCAGGKAKTCDDKNGCTLDSCNTFSGDCVFAPTLGLCSDGEFCTVNDRCEGGQCVGDAREVSTLAGNGSAGYVDGKGNAAKFYNPRGLTADLQGNVWVADYNNHSVRRISPKGVVETVAGTNTQAAFVDGKGASARFSGPCDVTLDGAGGVFVADRNNHRIRRVSSTGVVKVFAGNGSATYKDGTGTGASFYYPEGIGRGKDGTIYVADTYNHRIRQINKDGVVTLVAGSGSSTWKDGAKTAASFNYPRGIAGDNKGNIWVADSNNHRIRRIDPQGNVTTIAGNGTGTWKDEKALAASFYYPYGISVGPDGLAWVADRSNHRIRGINADGVVTTISGSSGGFKDDIAADALFNAPQGIHVDAKNNVYISEAGQRIRKIASPFNDCDDGTECTDNACDEVKDTCSATPVNDGQGCVDGKPCLSNRLCNQGICVGGVPKDCDDKNSCTTDSCDALTGDCVYKADPQVGCAVSRRVFITDNVWNASLGGIGGAHAKCQDAADNAGLGGEWKAWISDNSNYPAAYFDKASVPYRRLDGALLALNWNDLVDGTLDNSIDISETGAKVVSKSSSYCGSGYLPAVWTATTPQGTRYNSSTSTIYYCNNFGTSTTSSSYRAGAGIATASSGQWSQACTTQRCNYAAHLYCFEQSDHWSKN